VDEGFLVGYSVISKSFRVFNSRTRIVQEALHVNFLENKPNIAGNKDLSTEFEDHSDNSCNDVNATEADFNNLETSIAISPIPTTRIHKDHPISQIIGDQSSTTQIRSMNRVIKDQGGLSQIFNDDFHTCMFACSLSQEESKRVHQALKDLSWIEAMQEELLQFNGG
nr:retrovirus-related Pol polyprotein from transposon TNT 1-94 [Tanacetum cinerariifolium]